MKRLLICCIAVIASVSCSKYIEEGLPASGNGQCRVLITVGVETGSPATIVRSLTEEQESSLNDVNLYAVHPQTGIIRHVFLRGQNRVSLLLFKGSWEFYALGNLGYDLGDRTVPELSALTVDTREEDALASEGKTLMSLHESLEIGGDAAMNLRLVRLAAKLRVGVEVASGLPERIEIRSVRICNVPASARYIGDNDAAAYCDYSAHTVSGGSFSRVYYLPENLAGTVPSITEPNQRSVTNAPEHAVRIEIEAVCDGRSVSYYVYPGENDTSDFNIRRNGQYLLNITLCGANPADMRVDAFDIMPNTPGGDVYEQQKIPVTLECTANNYAGRTFDISYRSITGNPRITVNGVSATSGILAEGLSGTTIRETFEMTVLSAETGPVAVEFTMTDNKGNTLTRTLSWEMLPAKHIVFSPVYTYGMGTNAISASESELKATVSFSFTVSDRLPAPVTVSFDYYWQSRYTSGSDITENYLSYSLMTSEGKLGSGVTLFSAEAHGEPTPIYHKNGYYTRHGYMILDGGTLIIRSVSDPPPGYIYDIKSPRITYLNPAL